MKRPPRRRTSAISGSKEAVLRVETLGSQGDGTASHNGQPVYIPHTLPDEQVEVTLSPLSAGKLRGTVRNLLSPSPERIPPVCKHFGECGGCSLQHLRETSYHAFKRGLLVEAVERAGFSGTVVSPLVTLPHAARRRTEIQFTLRDKKLHAGYFSAHSHDITAISECHILHPALATLALSLPKYLETIGNVSRFRSAKLTLTDYGVDVILDVTAPLSPDEETRIATIAKTLDIARISTRYNGSIHPVATLKPVTLTLGKTRVEIPPDFFLQATAEGQQAILSELLAATLTSRKILDLFAGIGTYSFPLAERASVHAVEGDANMTAILKKAAGGGRVTAETRDLFAFPLTPQALGAYDTVILNPPRAGAKEQCAMLAKSSVPLIIMVSCNPASLARDAKLLKDGGYSLTRATPIDQFVWSAHLESACVFIKRKKSL